MKRREAILEAKLALANWLKYAHPEQYDEIVYQANKMADALRALLMLEETT